MPICMICGGEIMKNKIHSFLALLLAAVLLLGLTACGSAVARANNLSASYKRKTGESGEVTARFSAAYADFSFSLFEEVLNASAAGSNKLLSPLSAESFSLEQASVSASPARRTKPYFQIIFIAFPP